LKDEPDDIFSIFLPLPVKEQALTEKIKENLQIEDQKITMRYHDPDINKLVRLVDMKNVKPLTQIIVEVSE